MPRSWQSSAILVVVFGLGLAAGIAGMVWAWPGIRARFHNNTHPRETGIQRLQRTLNLTAEQVPQVQAVLKDAIAQRHAVHLTFQPDYARICGEFDQVLKKEHDALVPGSQQELNKLQAILTSAQWQTFQQERAANRRPPRPDLCRHPAPPPTSGAQPAPAGSPGTPHHR